MIRNHTKSRDFIIDKSIDKFIPQTPIIFETTANDQNLNFKYFSRLKSIDFDHGFIDSTWIHGKMITGYGGMINDKPQVVGYFIAERIKG